MTNSTGTPRKEASSYILFTSAKSLSGISNSAANRLASRSILLSDKNVFFRINNYSDRVMVSIQDSIKRVIRVDTLSILFITNHTDVQLKINELAGANQLAELDAVFENIDQLNVKAAASVREVEMELLLEDLLAMNREHAIDMALDTGDVEAFNKLLEVQI